VIGIKSHRSQIRGMKSVTRESYSMKRILIAFLCVSLLSPVQAAHATDLTLPKDTSVQVHFSPNGGCTDAINKALGQAKQEILVQAYSFTSAPDSQSPAGCP
jgi:hypothetical protein